MSTRAADALDSATGLHRLLAPSSIAIVGASETAGGYPAKVLRNVQRYGFTGEILPVNPKRESVFGLPCYPSLAALPQVPDLALIMVPAAAVEAAVRDAAQIGVGAAAIFSSGFAELGAEGSSAQERVAAIAAASGMRLLGPNCQGFFHLSSRVVASFSTVLEHGLRPSSGIAYVGQSGALGGAVLGLAAARGLGINSWFSTGNEADLSATEVCAAVLRDPEVQIVIVHLEAVPAGQRLQELVAAMRDTGKHVVCIRSGVSTAGKLAAASHTGAMVRDDAAFTLIARDSGVIVVDEIVGALDVVELLVAGRGLLGPGVGIITTSGGAGGLAADHLERVELTVPRLGERTQELLAKHVPAFGAVANPVDVTAQLFAGAQDSFGRVCSVTAADPAVDALWIVITNLAGQEALDVAHSVIDALAEGPKPIVVVWLAPDERITEARAALQERRIPVFTSFGAAAAALGHLWRPRAAPAADLPPELDVPAVAAALPDGVETVSEWNGARLIALAGIATPRGALARTADEAVTLAAGLDGRLVLKIQSPDIAHKTEVGGVRVGVPAQDVRASFDEIVAAVHAGVPEAVVDGVLVQEQAPDGVDLIVGLRGPADGYPPVITVGAGGVSTELYHDIASAVAPISPAGAEQLIRGLASAPLLYGFRGSQRLDVATLAAALADLSRVAASMGPRLLELEINPLRVTTAGVTALDLLVRLTPATT